MDELTGAKILRALLKGSAEEKTYILAVKFQNVDTGQVTIEQTAELQARLDEAKEAFDKYTEAVDRCQALEFGDYNPEDEHMIEWIDMEDDLFELDIKLQVLKARVGEEKSTRVRTETNAHEEPGNIVAKPPPQMEKGITLDEMETWSSTWEDYYQATKLEKEIPALQKPYLKSHLSVEHVLGIGPDSTKTCDKILGDLCNQSLDAMKVG